MNAREILEGVQHKIRDYNYYRYDEINQANNRVAELTDFSWLLVSSDVVVSFLTGVQVYALTSINMRTLKGIRCRVDSTEEWVEVEKIPINLFDDQDYVSATAGQPNSFKVMGTNYAEIKVAPVPDKNYTVRMEYIKETIPIIDGVTPDLPTQYHDALVNLASAYILQMNPKRSKEGYNLERQTVLRFKGFMRGDLNRGQKKVIEPSVSEWIT